MQSYHDLAEKEEENVQVTPSAILPGIRGLRARKQFKSGEPIMLYAGEILSIQQAARRREDNDRIGISSNYQVEMEVDNTSVVVDVGVRTVPLELDRQQMPFCGSAGSRRPRHDIILDADSVFLFNLMCV